MCRLLGIAIYEVLRFISFMIFHFHSIKEYFTFRTSLIILLSTHLGYQNLKAKGKGREGRTFQKKVFSTLYGGGSDVIRGAKFGLSSDFSVCFCLFVSLHPHVNHS